MIKVMTDNAANLPPELRAQYGITELCLTYTIDGEPVDISKPFDGHAFYEAMRKGAEVKTSMITPLAAREAMEPVLDRGDDVLYVGLSGAAAFAGTLLQIKPILQGDPEGKIVVLSKERGRKKAMDTLIQLYEELVEDKSAPVGISHAAAPAEALHLATVLRQAGCTGEILSVCHEPVTGAHVGPGMLALYFYSQTWR